MEKGKTIERWWLKVLHPNLRAFEDSSLQLSDGVGNLRDLKSFVFVYLGFSSTISSTRPAQTMIPLNWNLLISRRLCKYPLQHNHLPLKFSHVIKIYSSIFPFQYELYRVSVGWTWWLEIVCIHRRHFSPEFTTEKFNWCLRDFLRAS